MKFFKRFIELYLYHFHLYPYPYLSILQSLPRASKIKAKTPLFPYLSLTIHETLPPPPPLSYTHNHPSNHLRANLFPSPPFQIHKPVTLPYKPYMYSTLSILFLSLQLYPNRLFLLPSLLHSWYISSHQLSISP